MPKIKPFRGVHYDPARTYGLSPVIGPPEDLPDLTEARRVMHGHPYHALRLELGHPDTPGPYDPGDLRKVAFEKWIAEGILVRSEAPAFFVHEHRYRHDGLYHRRLGLFAAAELSDDPITGFRPHERIIQENLQYRHELLSSLRLSITPILTVIRDSGWLGVVLADLVHDRPPDLSGHDAEEGVHRVWILRDPYLTAWLQDLVAERPLYIADGHHRFAAAKAYRDQRTQRGEDPGAAQTVLTLIVSEFDPGISILPTHREIRRLPVEWGQAQERLESLFTVECLLKSDQIDSDLVGRRVRRISETQSDRPAFLMLRHEDQRLVRLYLREWDLVDHLLNGAQEENVRRLDASVMHRVLLEHVLGISSDDRDGIVAYTPDAEGLTRRVENGEAALGLYMRSPRIEQVLAVADAGAFMPQKSTYFYPKVPAGLVMYDLE